MLPLTPQTSDADESDEEIHRNSSPSRASVIMVGHRDGTYEPAKTFESENMVGIHFFAKNKLFMHIMPWSVCNQRKHIGRLRLIKTGNFFRVRQKSLES